MPVALGKDAYRRRDGACGALTAGLPAQRRPASGEGWLGAWVQGGKKRTPERSATQNLSASRSGARWQGGLGSLPPGAHALQGKRRE